MALLTKVNSSKSKKVKELIEKLKKVDEREKKILDENEEYQEALLKIQQAVDYSELIKWRLINSEENNAILKKKQSYIKTLNSLINWQNYEK